MIESNFEFASSFPLTSSRPSILPAPCCCVAPSYFPALSSLRNFFGCLKFVGVASGFYQVCQRSSREVFFDPEGCSLKMASSANVSNSRPTRTLSYDLDNRRLQHQRSHSRIRDDSAVTHSSHPLEPLPAIPFPPERSLLAYDMPTPSLAEFPMPPSVRILPHPHAPIAPTTGTVRPAILRTADSTQYIVPTSGTKTLANTLARAADAGHQRAAGGTIHGKTSMDLLSAMGPVPIQFALGSPASPTSSSSAPNFVEPPVPEDLTSGTLLTCTRGYEVNTNDQGDRRSFSGIISAIETPRLVACILLLLRCS